MGTSPGSTMVQASVPSTAGARQGSSLADWSWKRLLFIGFCGGLAFGLTHRVLSLQLEVPWSSTQPFGVRATPGSSLDSLRQRFGAESQAIRGDLDLIELEQQQKRERSEEQRRLERLEAEDRERREREQRELEQTNQAIPQDLPPELTSPAPPDPTLDLPPEPAPPPALPANPTP
ncbi:MAG: hypothetical protein VKK62_10100 [Synechococcaceae cyanobacterium]|nr:hypothetical protein [Synechococcaceae cyanobacterium]